MKRVSFRAVVLLLSMFLLVTGAACAQADPTNSAPPASEKGSAAKPKLGDELPVAKLTADGPVGLYYLQKYWIATRHLEKSVWYFAPDGTVYTDVSTGVSKEELKAHKGSRGTGKLIGNDLEVRWSDGQVSSSPIERDQKDPNFFMWDTGMFAPAPPITDPKLIAGSYEGGSSLSFSGNSTIIAKSLELHADGTFKLEGAASIRVEGDESNATAGGSSGGQGTWTASSYSLTLKFADGRSEKGIAFPFFEDEKTKQNDRLFYQGIMYKRK